MSGEHDPISVVPTTRGAAFPQHPSETEFVDLADRADEATKAAVIAMDSQPQRGLLTEQAPTPRHGHRCGDRCEASRPERPWLATTASMNGCCVTGSATT